MHYKRQVAQLHALTTIHSWKRTCLESPSTKSKGGQSFLVQPQSSGFITLLSLWFFFARFRKFLIRKRVVHIHTAASKEGVKRCSEGREQVNLESRIEAAEPRALNAARVS